MSVNDENIAHKWRVRFNRSQEEQAKNFDRLQEVMRAIQERTTKGSMGTFTKKRTRRGLNNEDKDLQAAEARVREYASHLRAKPDVFVDGQRRFLVIDVPMTKAVLTYEQSEEFMDVLESKIAQMARHVTET